MARSNGALPGCGAGGGGRCNQNSLVVPHRVLRQSGSRRTNGPSVVAGPHLPRGAWLRAINSRYERRGPRTSGTAQKHRCGTASWQKFTASAKNMGPCTRLENGRDARLVASAVRPPTGACVQQQQQEPSILQFDRRAVPWAAPALPSSTRDTAPDLLSMQQLRFWLACCGSLRFLGSGRVFVFFFVLSSRTSPASRTCRFCRLMPSWPWSTERSCCRSVNGWPYQPPCPCRPDDAPASKSHLTTKQQYQRLGARRAEQSASNMSDLWRPPRNYN